MWSVLRGDVVSNGAVLARMDLVGGNDLDCVARRVELHCEVQVCVLEVLDALVGKKQLVGFVVDSEGKVASGLVEVPIDDALTSNSLTEWLMNIVIVATTTISFEAKEF